MAFPERVNLFVRDKFAASSLLKPFKYCRPGIVVDWGERSVALGQSDDSQRQRVLLFLGQLPRFCNCLFKKLGHRGSVANLPTQKK
jgi:hypothetical protein